jgi:glycosyltransferase involved in cell wall biosynthesis
MRQRIMAGEFDLVLRLMPITAVLPSAFAFFLRRGPIPFVIGPINGGLPWPEGFTQAKKDKEWISQLRSVYRLLPFARSTYRYASAIIAGSSRTFAEFSAYRDKLFFVPENGVTRSLLTSARPNERFEGKLELVFVGGLVPIKGCDLALRAAAPLLRRGSARFTIVGDGPERARLESLASSLGIQESVLFRGMLPHAEAMECMREGDVFVFPSVRDFGAGVVFEALSLGVVPIVLDFGGPGDIVHSEVGYKVALTNESDVVSQIEKILLELDENRPHLEKLRRQAMQYARECLSWDGKAQIVSRILYWVLGEGPKPDLPAPKTLY